MGEAKQWCVSDRVELVWREWEAESVAYDRFSGDLHYFDPITAAALQCVARTPCDEAAVVHEVARTLDLSPDQDLALFLSQALQRLSRLGLIAVK